MTSEARPTCPDCQSLMVPYLYGYPAGPPPEDGGPDDFFIAGCLPDFPSPAWDCRTCQIRERDALDQEVEQEFGPNWMHNLMDDDDE